MVLEVSCNNYLLQYIQIVMTGKFQSKQLREKPKTKDSRKHNFTELAHRMQQYENYVMAKDASPYAMPCIVPSNLCLLVWIKI